MPPLLQPAQFSFCESKFIFGERVRKRWPGEFLQMCFNSPYFPGLAKPKLPKEPPPKPRLGELLGHCCWSCCWTCCWSCCGLLIPRGPPPLSGVAPSPGQKGEEPEPEPEPSAWFPLEIPWDLGQEQARIFPELRILSGLLRRARCFRGTEEVFQRGAREHLWNSLAFTKTFNSFILNTAWQTVIFIAIKYSSSAY